MIKTMKPETEPKLLDTEIKKNGFAYIQERRGERAFIYRQTDPETTEGGEARTVGFEVFKRKVSRAQSANMGGTIVEFEAKEKFPSNESFGLWAWAFKSWEKALEKFNELENAPEL